jgi:hypothetical protein
MPENDFSKDTPQFDTASYSATPNTATSGTDRCAACQQPIAGLYYRINGKMACGSCCEQVRRQVPKDSPADYLRGVLFGVGAAIVGLILYAGFTIATGFYIGYVSLAVGWMVGKAIMAGSKGIGGRRYQVAAVLLTYAAVSMAAIPIAISAIRHKNSEGLSTAAKNHQPTASEQPATPDGQAPPTEEKNSESKTKPPIGLGTILATLVLLGLASPFLELQEAPLQGIIGLVILFVGIQIAWKLTKGKQAVDIQGPYGDTSAALA